MILSTSSRTIFESLQTSIVKFFGVKNAAVSTLPGESTTQESAPNAASNPSSSEAPLTIAAAKEAEKMPEITKTEQATRTLERWANDDRYGYAWGGWGPFDYDCGHAVIDAWEKAGVLVKSKGAAWTGNMREVFTACGFKDVTGLVNLKNGNGLQRGDVLLNTELHAAQCVGNGKLVHARSSEGNSITGDQNGKEFCVQNYFNYPWNCVLRYPEPAENVEEAPEETVQEPEEIVTVNVPKLARGCVNQAVRAMQALLIMRGYNVGPDGADGDFGSLTVAALIACQTGKNLQADGICGADTWQYLITGEVKK